MRSYARLRAGRIFALAMRVWVRRSLQIHAVVLLCLAPFVIVPGFGDADPSMLLDAPFRDGSVVGLFGLFPSAWALAADFRFPQQDFRRNVTILYLAQFVVSMLVARDAYRHIAGREPRCGPRAAMGLVILALGTLALFVALHSPAVASDGSPLTLVLGIAAIVADIYIAGACWLAFPAAATQSHGIFAALTRGRLLSAGSRLSIAALIVMLVVLQGVTLFPILILISRGNAPLWLMFVPMILLLTLKACVLAAAYHEACFRKEGAGAEEISAVFA